MRGARRRCALRSLGARDGTRLRTCRGLRSRNRLTWLRDGAPLDAYGGRTHDEFALGLRRPQKLQLRAREPETDWKQCGMEYDRCDKRPEQVETLPLLVALFGDHRKQEVLRSATGAPRRVGANTFSMQSPERTPDPTQEEERQEGRLLRTLLWFGLGIGIAGLGVAIVYASARLASPEVRDDPTSQRIQQLIDEANTLLKALDDQRHSA